MKYQSKHSRLHQVLDYIIYGTALICGSCRAVISNVGCDNILLGYAIFWWGLFIDQVNEYIRIKYYREEASEF